MNDTLEQFLERNKIPITQDNLDFFVRAKENFIKDTFSIRPKVMSRIHRNIRYEIKEFSNTLLMVENNKSSSKSFPNKKLCIVPN